MEMAQSSAVIELPTDQTHEQWLEFVGEVERQPTGNGAEDVPKAHLPDEAEKGRVYFGEAGESSTLVTMDLQYSPQALRQAGLEPDWLPRRIGLFLQRFKDFAEHN